MLTSVSKPLFQATPVSLTRSYHSYCKQALRKVRRSLPSLEVIITFLTLDEILNLFSLNSTLWRQRQRHLLPFGERPCLVYQANTRLATKDGFQAGSLSLRIETVHFQLKPELASRLRRLTLNELAFCLDGGYGVSELEARLFGLEGLAACTNLLQLEVEELGLAKLDTLAGMTKLEELTLTQTRLPKGTFPVLPALKSLQLEGISGKSNLSFLKGCSNLERLTLFDYEQLSSLAGLSALTKLRHCELDFEGRSVKEDFLLAELAACSKLETLVMNLVSVDDSSFLNSLTRLRKVALSAPTSPDLTFIRYCPELTELTLTHCKKLTNLAGIEYGTRLKSIVLDNVAQLDLTSLQACVELTSLQLLTTMSPSPDFNLQGLSNLAKLEKISLIISAALKEVDYLQGCKNLRSFFFQGNSLQTSRLADFPLLEEIWLALNHSCEITLVVTPRLKQLFIKSRSHPKLIAAEGQLSLEKLELTVQKPPSGCYAEKEEKKELDSDPFPDLSPYTGVKELRLRGLELTNLSFLEKYTRLEQLELAANALTHFKLVSPLPSLKVLKLNALYRLRKISDLSACPKLELLSLSGMSLLERIPSLEKLTMLREIEFNGLEKVTKLPSLGQKPHLKLVTLNRLDYLEAVPDLSGCPELEELCIHVSKALLDITGIHNCPSLRKLDISISTFYFGDRHTQEKPVIRVASFEACPAIESLNLDSCGSLYDYRALTNLTSLRKLAITDTKIKRPLNLNNCQQLEELKLDLESPLLNTDLTFLSRCQNLSILSFDNVSFAGTLEGLQNHTSLLSLVLNNAVNVSNLDALTGCINLVALALRNSSLTSLTGLKSLPNLSILDLLNSKEITSLSGIEQVSKLEKLVLRGTKVRDLTPLTAHSKLAIVLLPSTERGKVVTSFRELPAGLHLIDENGDEEGDEEEGDEEEGDEEEGDEEDEEGDEN